MEGMTRRHFLKAAGAIGLLGSTGAIAGCEGAAATEAIATFEMIANSVVATFIADRLEDAWDSIWAHLKEPTKETHEKQSDLGFPGYAPIWGQERASVSILGSRRTADSNVALVSFTYDSQAATIDIMCAEAIRRLLRDISKKFNEDTKDWAAAYLAERLLPVGPAETHRTGSHGHNLVTIFPTQIGSYVQITELWYPSGDATLQVLAGQLNPDGSSFETEYHLTGVMPDMLAV